MTNISYLSGLKGVPGDEYRQRGALVKTAPSYIPYLAMTKGEFNLALTLESLKIDQSFYPESRDISRAVSMLENSLYGGISRGVNFIGVIPDNLQSITRLISTASRQTAPASKGSIIMRDTPGIRIGDPIIPVKWSALDCKEYVYDIFKAEYYDKLRNIPKVLRLPYPAKNIAHKLLFNNPVKKVRERYQELYLGCQYKQAVENILNENLERGSLHMLYHLMSTSFEPSIGTLAQTKRLFHRAGVSDIAKTADIDGDQMTKWVSLGQKRSAVSGGIDPVIAISPVMSALLAPGGEVWAEKVLADIKVRSGASVNSITVAAITTLITVIGGALTAAANLANSFNKSKIQTLQNAQGFGTDAFQPEKNDFLKPKGDTPLPTPKGNDNNLLLIGGAAVAAYILTRK